MRLHDAIPFLLCALACGVPAQGPLQWRQLTHAVPPLAAAWDAARQETVLVCNEGGLRHFTWNGTAATERLRALAPVSTWVGYDPLRRELVGVQVPATTGAATIGRFDGARWSSVSAPNPALEARVRCAFDERRGRLVAFAGASAQPSVEEWDGTTWWSTPALPGPGQRVDAAFAFDPSSQRCVLYGGSNGGTPLADCWSWDGSTWTLLAANAPPGPRSGAALAAAPNGQLLLYGGSTSTATWQLAGATWVPVPTVHDPGPRTGATLVRDAFGLLLLGGSGDPIGTAWRFANGDWNATAATFVAPPQTPRIVAAFDRVRGQVVVCSGEQYPAPAWRTWLYDSSWRGTAPSTSPPPRNGAQLCWSPGNQRVLLFGGVDAMNTELADTWTWTGTDWVQHLPAASPPGRHAGLVAEDPAGTVMLLGGVAGTSFLFDQWHWDGAQWQQRTANTPFLNLGPSIAYDPLRGRTVLLTMVAPAVLPTTLTHEWDGTAWTLAATMPLATMTPRPMGFDPKRGALVTAGTPAFQWNGIAWTNLGGSLTNSWGQLLVTDDARQRLLGFQTGVPLLVAEATDRPADAASFGTGCALGPSPALAASGYPTPGNGAFAIDFGTLAPAAPAFLVLGLGEQYVSLGGGCAALIAVPLATRAAVAGPGTSIRIGVPIPNDPGLRGVQVVAQGAVWEPGRSLLGTVTLTTGLRIAIGD